MDSGQPVAISRITWSGECVWIRPLAGGEPVQYLKVDRRRSQAALSPDGRWRAFTDGLGDDRRQLELQTFPVPCPNWPETPGTLREPPAR